MTKFIKTRHPVKTRNGSDEVTVVPIFRERGFVFDAKLVFVLMPFGEPWSDRIWEALRQIILGLGLRSERADNRHGPVVTEDIWRGIVEARVVLADVTGWNPNMFYELGVAHTLGKDTILITQPSARLPFDTQGFRHVIYSDNPAGIKLLETEIPQKIDYYIKPPGFQNKTRREAAVKKTKIENPSKLKKNQEIQAAWVAIGQGWEPPLPSKAIKDARSNAGELKKRMKEYVYFLSEPDAKLFVTEVRKKWPDNFEQKEDSVEVQNIFAEVTNVLNEWRSKYSERVAG